MDSQRLIGGVHQSTEGGSKSPPRINILTLYLAGGEHFLALSNSADVHTPASRTDVEFDRRSPPTVYPKRFQTQRKDTQGRQNDLTYRIWQNAMLFRPWICETPPQRMRRTIHPTSTSRASAGPAITACVAKNASVPLPRPLLLLAPNVLRWIRQVTWISRRSAR